MWNWYKLAAIADLDIIQGVNVMRSFSLNGAVENITFFKNIDYYVIFRNTILRCVDGAFVVGDVGAMAFDGFLWVGEYAG